MTAPEKNASLVNCSFVHCQVKFSTYVLLGNFTVTKLPTTRNSIMLWTVFVILLVMWALGLATGATLNGFIHILLVIAIVVVLLRVIQGRRVI